MWSGTPRIFFVLTLVLNCILWSQSRYGQVKGVHSTSRTFLARRSDLDIHHELANVSFGGHGKDEVRTALPQHCGICANGAPVPSYSFSEIRGSMFGRSRIMSLLGHLPLNTLSTELLLL